MRNQSLSLGNCTAAEQRGWPNTRTEFTKLDENCKWKLNLWTFQPLNQNEMFLHLFPLCSGSVSTSSWGKILVWLFTSSGATYLWRLVVYSGSIRTETSCHVCVSEELKSLHNEWRTFHYSQLRVDWIIFFSALSIIFNPPTYSIMTIWITHSSHLLFGVQLNVYNRTMMNESAPSLKSNTPIYLNIYTHLQARSGELRIS